MISEYRAEIAELVCIILGDGHIHKKGEKKYTNSEVRISLNRVKEKEYVKYVKGLIERIFRTVPKEYPRKGSDGIDIRLYGIKYVKFFLERGLFTGNKKYNQVRVPNWIKSEKIFVIKGLKGLFDTDGSVYVATRDKTIHLNFRNASKPLAKDFKDMCSLLDIRTGKVGFNISRKNNKDSKGYFVQIQSRSNVKKFLEIIQPERWHNHKKDINRKLSQLGTSIKDALVDSRKKQNY